MSKYCVKNVETNEFLYETGNFGKNVNKAAYFPTFKRAQKEAKKYNKKVESFYQANDENITEYRGKSCSKFQPVRVNQ